MNNGSSRADRANAKKLPRHFSRPTLAFLEQDFWPWSALGALQASPSQKNLGPEHHTFRQMSDIETLVLNLLAVLSVSALGA
mgnify:CR=1 FL=1